MLNKVIVISPHPDDETLGAGGTILKYKDLGNKVYWLNVTNIKKEFGFGRKEVERRKSEIERVRRQYNFDGLFNLELEPAGLEKCRLTSIVENISKVFIYVKPTTVFLPYKNDIHSDHRIVFDAAYACTKVFRYPFIKKVLMMEVISETDSPTSETHFFPNYFIDVSKYLEKKIKIMKLYKSEIKNHPFSRSEEHMRALATIRGSQAGCKYAEGFMLLKEIG